MSYYFINRIQQSVLLMKPRISSSESWEEQKYNNQSSKHKPEPFKASNQYHKYLAEMKVKKIDIGKTIELFSKAGITYNPSKQFLHFSFEPISRIKTGQILSIRSYMGFFEVELNMLINFDKQNPFMNTVESQSGCFSKIFFFNFYGCHLALKSIKNFNLEASRSQFSKVVQEITLMKIASILQCTVRMEKYLGFDAIIYKESFVFAMEMGEKLFGISRDEVLRSLKQILETLHSFQIIHFDIKPENIVFSPYFNKIVFIDFGFSEIILEPVGFKTYTPFRGTPIYCGEEMIEILSIDGKSQYVDVYYNDLFSLNESVKCLMQKMRNFDSAPKIIEPESNQVNVESIHLELQFYNFQYHYIWGNRQSVNQIIEYKGKRLLKFKSQQLLAFILRVMPSVFNLQVFISLKPYQYLAEYQIIQRSLQIKTEKISHFYLQQLNFHQQMQQESDKLDSYYRFLANISQSNFKIQNSFSFKVINNHSNSIANFQNGQLVERDFKILFHFMRFDVKKLTFYQKTNICTLFKEFIKQNFYPDISPPYCQIKFFFKYVLKKIVLNDPINQWAKATFFDAIYQLILLKVPIQEEIDTYVDIIIKQQNTIIERSIVLFSFFKILGLIFCIDLKDSTKDYFLSLNKKIVKIIATHRAEILSNFQYHNEEEKAIIKLLHLLVDNQKSRISYFTVLKQEFTKITNKRLKILLQSMLLQINYKMLLQNGHHDYIIYNAKKALASLSHFQLHNAIIFIKRYTVFLQAFNELLEFNKKIKIIMGCEQVYLNLDLQRTAFLINPHDVDKEKCMNYLRDICDCFEQYIQLDKPVINIMLAIFSKLNMLKIDYSDKPFLKSLFIKVEQYIFTKFKPKANTIESYARIFLNIKILYKFKEIGYESTRLDKEKIQLQIVRQLEIRYSNQITSVQEAQNLIISLFTNLVYLTQYFYNQIDKKLLIDPLEVLSNITYQLKMYQLWFYNIHKIVMVANIAQSLQVFSRYIRYIYQLVVKNYQIIPFFYMQPKRNDLYFHLSYFSKFNFQVELYHLIICVINWLKKNPFDTYIHIFQQNFDKFCRYYSQSLMFQKISKFIPINEVKKNPYSILCFVNTAFIENSSIKFAILKKITPHFQSMSCFARYITLKKYFHLTINLPQFSKRKIKYISTKTGKKYLQNRIFHSLIKKLKNKILNSNTLHDKILAKHKILFLTKI